MSQLVECQVFSRLPAEVWSADTIFAFLGFDCASHPCTVLEQMRNELGRRIRSCASPCNCRVSNLHLQLMFCSELNSVVSSSSPCSSFRARPLQWHHGMACRGIGTRFSLSSALIRRCHGWKGRCSESGLAPGFATSAQAWRSIFSQD